MSKKHFQTINRIWEQKKIGLRLRAEGNPVEAGFLVRLEDSGEKRFDFIRRAIRYSLEYSLKRKGRKILLKESREALSEAPAFQALSSFQLYFNPSLEEECEEEDFLPEISSDTEMQGRGESALLGNAKEHFYKAVEELEQLLLHLDWSAEKIEVYRLWQSRTHKPQDKIEIKGECFSCNALVNISSYGRGSEKVRLRLPKEDFALGFTSSYAGDGAGGIGEMIFLTNRLIEQLFGEKWDRERLGYAPVIVYEYAREDYAIGLPLADKLDGIFLSSLLAESKKDEAKSYDYMVFNRYTDSRLHLDFTKADYLLKAEWSSETDDRNNVARLNSNMMNLLGVSENDKIVIHFGKKQAVLRVLDKDTLSDYQIGIPAPTRKSLGMNSINDIVTVHRDMMHIFLRHSEEQTIAFLGTFLAVFQVISNLWLGTLLCIVLVPAILYLVLNEERIKVK